MLLFFLSVDMSTSLTRYVLAVLELDILPFALRTSIRYEINPSFAKQTYRVRQHISNAAGVYRKSCKGFISMRDTLLRVSRYRAVFVFRIPLPFRNLIREAWLRRKQACRFPFYCRKCRKAHISSLCRIQRRYSLLLWS